MKRAMVLLIIIKSFFIVTFMCLMVLVGYNYLSRFWLLYCSPTNQHNTKWESQDGSIVFWVDDHGNKTGTIDMEGQIVEVRISATYHSMYIYDIKRNDLQPGESTSQYWLGEWDCSYKSKKKFVATVVESKINKNTIFEVGQRITFYRVD